MELRQLVESIGAGGENRTLGLGIMSSATPTDSKQDKSDSSAKCGEVRQNPQPPRNPKPTEGGEL
jgi:hypothetical protein